MIVLGQAKCVDPQTSISPDQVARVVARLQRGWLGVYVTTGVVSHQAQVEIIDDRYPVVLIPGGRLAEVARLLAFASYGGDVDAMLAANERRLRGRGDVSASRGSPQRLRHHVSSVDRNPAQL